MTHSPTLAASLSSHPLRQIVQAVALLCAAVPAWSQTVDNATLNKVEISIKAPATLDATESAPSQGSLAARSAVSIVGDTYIRDYTAPIADYTQALTLTPGVFSVSPNGVGLGDAKITLRGLSDSFSVISFDGIPFNDTNGVSHHSWVFFPSQFLGGAVVDRSPGSAATIGQATFGGNIDLKSRVLGAEAQTSVTASTSSWNTRLLNLEHQSGAFGADGGNNLLLNIHEMKSDGYQTYNRQDRTAMSAKFQKSLSPNTTLTLFGSFLDLKNNTPNTKGVSRANYDVGNYTYLLSGDRTRADYFGYNFYDVMTDFFYAGIQSNLGNGWKLEDKFYRYSYHNKQNYNGATISATSATDKLNAYTTIGNVLRVTRDSAMGTLRAGLWIDRADSHRFQVPSDPRTWVDSATPNFNESYITTTMQPYVEHEFKIGDSLKVTPGVKLASYKQAFTHLQDNGGAVGTLGGTYSATTGKITGGAAALTHEITYKDSLPSLDVHYLIRPNWSAYAQYAEGDQIPSTSVFDVKNASVSPAPKATRAKTTQIGTVWNSGAYALAGDIYSSKLDGAYTALPPDANGNVAYVYGGNLTNQGIEGEANIALGSGFSLYANATIGSLKYASGQWVSGAPSDTEALALNYQHANWSASWSTTRVGRVYNDAKSGAHEAFAIDPMVVSNLFVNYTVKKPFALAKWLKLQLAVNNVFNRHTIVGIASPVAATPQPGDLLTILPARSVALTGTLAF